jgi:hypothetical protein
LAWGVDGDPAQAGHIHCQAALGHRGPGNIVATALDAEQQPMLAGEGDRGGGVVGRGRLEDQGGEPGRHAVPDRNGLVPALVAGHQQPTLDPRAQVLQLLGAQRAVSAVNSGELDGAGHGHDRASSKPVGCLRLGSSVYSKRQ